MVSSYGYGEVQDRLWAGVLGDLFQSDITPGVNCKESGIRRFLGVYKKTPSCTGKNGTMNPP